MLFWELYTDYFVCSVQLSHSAEILWYTTWIMLLYQWYIHWLLYPILMMVWPKRSHGSESWLEKSTQSCWIVSFTFIIMVMLTQHPGFLSSGRLHHSFSAILQLPMVCPKSLKLYLTLCDPMDCRPPGSSVHGILQTRTLKWVVTPSSRRSSWPRDWTHISYISCTGRWVLYH